jgi:hypothetical protein
LSLHVLLEALVPPHSIFPHTGVACSCVNGKASSTTAAADIADHAVDCRAWTQVGRSKCVLALVNVVVLVLVRLLCMVLISARALRAAGVLSHGFVQVSILTVYVGHAAATAKATDHVQEAIEHRFHFWIVMLTLLPGPGVAMVVEAMGALQVLLDIGCARVRVGVIILLPLLRPRGP